MPLEGNDTTVDLLHLTPGRRYSVVVFARNAYGQGVRSEELDAYTVRSEGKCLDACMHLAVAHSTRIVAIIITRRGCVHACFEKQTVQVYVTEHFRQHYERVHSFVYTTWK